MFVAASCLIAACSGGDSNFAGLSPTARVAMLGGNLMVRVAIDANDAAKSGTDCAALGADWASRARGRLILVNTGSTCLAAGGWTFYVHRADSTGRRNTGLLNRFLGIRPGLPQASSIQEFSAALSSTY